VDRPPLNDAEFSAAVAAVTSAFGDPTRRDIFLFVRDAAVVGVTAAELAERFELHANVARHHLDKLAAGGYLDVHVDRLESAGAGRPSKRYRVTEKALEFPARRDDLLVTLLGRALALLPEREAAAMAEQVGEEYGRALAHQMSPGDGHHRSFQASLHAVAEALTAHGFAAHAEARGSSLAIVAEQCPFGDTATQHPVICAVDRGIVRGMLAGLYGDTAPATTASRAQGDDACVTAV
jgi:predicted ArsR family transcriptional regulator